MTRNFIPNRGLMWIWDLECSTLASYCLSLTSRGSWQGWYWPQCQPVLSEKYPPVPASHQSLRPSSLSDRSSGRQWGRVSWWWELHHRYYFPICWPETPSRENLPPELSSLPKCSRLMMIIHTFPPLRKIPTETGKKLLAIYFLSGLLSQVGSGSSAGMACDPYSKLAHWDRRFESNQRRYSDRIYGGHRLR